MEFYLKYLIILFVVISISGCSSFTSPAREHELDNNKSYWLDYDVTRRGTIISNENSNWRSCAEPSPDAAVNLVSKLEGSLNVADTGEAKAKGELNQNIIKMAEKTQMVMFLRESMYRLCELSINSNLTSEQIQKLYATVMQSSLQVLENEKLVAQKEVIKAETEKVKVEGYRLESANRAQFIYNFLSEQKVDPKVIQKLLTDIP